MDLDYEKAFKVNITRYESKNPDVKQFCWVYPSIIEAELQWTTPYPTVETWYYDNIVYHNEYYFMLDSKSLNILVAQDFEKGTFYTIESTFSNPVVNDNYEVPYLILDEVHDIIFVVTTQFILSYETFKFFTALRQNRPIPKLDFNAYQNYQKFQAITSVEVYKDHLFIVGDGKVNAYLIDPSKGEVALEKTIDENLIGIGEVNIVDMTFATLRKRDYLFALDKLQGIHVIDITSIQSMHPLLGKRAKIDKGDFIIRVENSLSVIVAQGKNPAIVEYVLSTDENGDPTIEFNRRTELAMAVRDVYTDGAYLYLLSGYINLVTKHSIPGRYNSSELEYLDNTWISLGAKAIVANPQNDYSEVIVLTEDFIQNFTFKEINPEMECSIRRIPPGEYKYELEAVQSQCELKDMNSQSDFNTVCIIKETFNFIVDEDNANLSSGGIKISTGSLLVAVAFMVVLVLIFCYIARLYIRKYRALENQIKFTRLRDEENKGPSSMTSVDPEGGDRPAPEFNKQPSIEENQEPQEIPKPEIGEIKPLDLDEIYGNTEGKNDAEDL